MKLYERVIEYVANNLSDSLKGLLYVGMCGGGINDHDDEFYGLRRKKKQENVNPFLDCDGYLDDGGITDGDTNFDDEGITDGDGIVEESNVIGNDGSGLVGEGGIKQIPECLVKLDPYLRNKIPKNKMPIIA